MNNVQILFGAAGIKAIYGESLENEALDIICLSIKTREILPDKVENRSYASTKDQSKNQVRFIKNKYASESDLLVSQSKVVLISYDKTNPLAIVITDQELVNSFRAQFSALWEKLA